MQIPVTRSKRCDAQARCRDISLNSRLYQFPLQDNVIYIPTFPSSIPSKISDRIARDDSRSGPEKRRRTACGARRVPTISRRSRLNLIAKLCNRSQRFAERASSGGSSGLPRTLPLHSRVSPRAIDSRVCHPHFLARSVHATPLAIPEIRALESTLSRASPSPTSRRPFYSPSPFLNRRASSIVAFDRSPRYPRGTRDTSSSSSLRGSPRRAKRRASRRGSAARSASAPRAFLSLERPRGSPIGYLARCFAVGRVAYCPGEPRLRPP